MLQRLDIKVLIDASQKNLRKLQFVDGEYGCASSCDQSVWKLRATATVVQSSSNTEKSWLHGCT